MKVFTIEELTGLGVPLIEVQKSLTLNYLGKEFSRKSDIPKKFKEKALNLCQEIYRAGSDSFITETNYSYTIWQEEKSRSQVIDNEKSSTSNKITPQLTVRFKQSKSFSSFPYSLKNYISQEKKEQEQNQLSRQEINSAITEQNKIQENQLKTTSSPIEEIENNHKTAQVYKYRGVLVQKNASIPQSSRNTNKSKKKLTKTYRGVSY